MSYLLTRQKFLDALRALVEENPEFIYVRPSARGLPIDSTGCVYGEPSPDGEITVGSCALGQVLEKLDPEVFGAVVRGYNSDYSWGDVVLGADYDEDPSAHLSRLFEFESQEDRDWIASFGNAFQSNQDHGVPWRECWDRAQEAVGS